MKKNNIPPVYIVTVLFILGIISKFYDSYVFFLPALAVAAVFHPRSGAVFSTRMKWFFTYFAVFLFAFFYTGHHIPAPPDAGAPSGKKVTGRVRGFPKGLTFILKTEEGRFLVWTKASMPHPGDTVSVSGKFLPLEERYNFSDVNWYEINTIKKIKGRIFAKNVQVVSRSSGLNKLLYETRKKLDEKMSCYFSGKNAAYLRGFIWGDKSDLSDAVLTNFRRTGLMHLLAVSGLHIGLFTTVFAVFISFFAGPRRALLLCIPFAFLYSFLCGASVSSLRAAIMFSILAAGLYIGRRGSMGSGLFASALVMLLIDPLSIFQVGFQLSYLATAGIIFLSPKITGFLNRFLPKSLASVISIGFSCQIFIIPILNNTFLEFSVINPFINPFVLPIAGGIVFSIFLFFLSCLLGVIPFMGFISLNLARIFSSAGSFFITVLDVILNRAGAVSFAMVGFGHLAVFLCIAYYLFLSAVVSGRRKFLFVSALVIAGSIFYQMHDRREFRLYIPKFDRGECVFISSSGKWYQIGTASDIEGKLQDGYLRFLKFYGIKEISGCFILSSSIYHLGAFENILSGGFCRNFYYGPDIPRTNEFENILYLSKGKGILKKLEGDFAENGFVFSIAGEALMIRKGDFLASYASGLEILEGDFDVCIGGYCRNCKFCIIPKEEEKGVILRFGKKVKRIKWS
ncbi:MAG: ComEC/Rec2 family competence protein [bacterium]